MSRRERRVARSAGLATGVLGLLGATAWLVGDSGLAGLAGAGMVAAAAGALHAAARGYTRRELRAALGMTVGLSLLPLLGGGAFLAVAHVPGAVNLSSRDGDELGPLPAFAAQVGGSLEAVVFGPEGNRRTRAAASVLARLDRVRPGGLTWRRMDPESGATRTLLGRAAQLGEVAFLAGGRVAVARDAAPRSLAGALRGLADPDHREVRFVVPGTKVAPGPPEPFHRAGARLASELGAAVTRGPADPGARVWVLDVELGLPEPAALGRHLARGGGAILLLEGEPGAPWREFLRLRGLEVGEGWLLDDSPGPGRTRADVRVTAEGADGVALLHGARALAVREPARPLVVPAMARQLGDGLQAAASRPGRLREPNEVAGVLLEDGRGYLAVLGDRDWASDAGLHHGPNLHLLAVLGARAMDRTAPLPAGIHVPMGGVDPDLSPARFRAACFLLVVAFPALPFLAGLALAGARGRGFGGVVA